MRLVHNESIFEALEIAKNEIDIARQDLDYAIAMLEDLLESTNEKIKQRFLQTALIHIKDAKNRLYKD